MYIKAVHIKNIRSITSFEISFNEEEEAGWHILLGNNGSGKSTIVKSISLALVGPQFSGELRENWGDWLNVRNDKGIIQLDIIPDTHYDKVSSKGKTHYDPVINAIISIERKENAIPEYQLDSNLNKTKQGISPKRYNWGEGKGWFSAAYGPFRRFSGGNLEKEKIYYSAPKAGAHLSVFGEDVALSEATQFIKEVYIKGLEKQPGWDYLEDLQNFINCSGLLPKGTTMEKVTSDDVIFNDAHGNDISVLQLSDGYRSVLSLTFELVRQLIRVYGKELVLKNIKNGDYLFDLPGVVLIDEIDTHLHPTWQTNIGTILTQLFPKIQFIVTTHSPLVCRAAEAGSIWRLPPPGQKGNPEKITGDARNQLIYGNVLDAYETDVFGEDLERGEKGKVLRKRWIDLKHSVPYQKTPSPADQQELEELDQIFKTDAPIDL